MSTTNVPLVTMMSVTIALCAGAMVMSSMAASAAAQCKCTDDTAHKYSTYTAVVCGLSAAIIGVALGVYIYREPIVGSLSDLVKSKSS